MWYLGPTKPPTSSEFAVIVLGIAGLLMALGVVALIVGFRAAPEQHETAVTLEVYGLGCLGLGAAIAFIFWLVRRFTN